MAAEGLGDRKQNAGDLHLLLFAQPDEIVVLVDDCEGFDEGGLAARRQPVDDARHLDAGIRAHGNHETSVAECDDFLLHGPSLLTQEAFERAVDAVAADLNLMADAAQFRAGIIVDFAAGKHLAPDFCEQPAQIRNAACDARQARVLRPLRRIP